MKEGRTPLLIYEANSYCPEMGNFMFTGIITHTGQLAKKNKALFSFEAEPSLCKQLKLGGSIAVNGVCLTISTQPKKSLFSVRVMPETLKKTILDQLKPGSLVNLELPATISSFLSGHLVQGHVDGLGVIRSIIKNQNSRLVNISIPQRLVKYITDKGSIAVNGISLTIIKVKDKSFSVGIIPYTWKNTCLQEVKVGASLNLEVDIIAKYVAKLL